MAKCKERGEKAGKKEEVGEKEVDIKGKRTGQTLRRNGSELCPRTRHR